MPFYRVKFMNHIVETYLAEATNEEEAWNADPGDYEDKTPEDWDCTMCEVTDVEEYKNGHRVEGVAST